MTRIVAFLATIAAPVCFGAEAVRLAQDPLITQQMSKTLGDNVNGPTVIRVPQWIEHPLGRYYLYFAHHKGDHIRLAYANAPGGPWKIYEPGALNVKDTEFYRPQPDPPTSPDTLYTHVASPEIYVDDEHRQLVMYVHGWYTAGKRWPDDPQEALNWVRENGYAQFTQTTVSKDGIHFEPRPGITAKTSYQRIFRWHGMYYSMGRLGVLGRTDDPLKPFDPGPNPFAGTGYRGRVRHVGLVLRGDTLYVFFSAIGDAPERILLSTIALTDDWKDWKASRAQEVIAPKEKYDCVDLPKVASKAGESEGPENALRDPFVFEEGGKSILFYSYCGEQGLAAADVTSFLPAASR